MKASTFFFSFLGASSLVTALPHEAAASNETEVFDTNTAAVPIFDRRGVRFLQTRFCDGNPS